jgi:hypothetical protein
LKSLLKRVDVGQAWDELRAGPLVGECRGVPGLSKGRAGKRADARKIRENADRSRAPERVGTKRIERRAHDDLNIAVERRTPEIGGILKRNQSLLPERGAGIAANWRNWCRIVESFARPVVVDDRDFRRGINGRGDRQDGSRQCDREHTQIGEESCP